VAITSYWASVAYMTSAGAAPAGLIPVSEDDCAINNVGGLL